MITLGKNAEDPTDENSLHYSLKKITGERGWWWMGGWVVGGWWAFIRGPFIHVC